MSTRFGRRAWRLAPLALGSTQRAADRIEREKLVRDGLAMVTTILDRKPVDRYLRAVGVAAPIESIPTPGVQGAGGGDAAPGCVQLLLLDLALQWVRLASTVQGVGPRPAPHGVTGGGFSKGIRELEM